MSGRLLTARGVAERLGVSVETVLRWARRGELPAIYLSTRAIRFEENELDAWLEKRATPGPKAPTIQSGATRQRTLSSVAPTIPPHDAATTEEN